MRVTKEALLMDWNQMHQEISTQPIMSIMLSCVELEMAYGRQ